MVKMVLKLKIQKYTDLFKPPFLVIYSEGVWYVKGISNWVLSQEENSI
jgi:hypothetical protein